MKHHAVVAVYALGVILIFANLHMSTSKCYLGMVISGHVKLLCKNCTYSGCVHKGQTVCKYSVICGACC